MSEQKLGWRTRRKEILSEDLYKVVDSSISARQKAEGVKTFPGIQGNDTFRVGKGRIFNQEAWVYVENIGFFPNIWITSPKGDHIAKNIVEVLEKRKLKPHLHRGLPEVLE